MTEFFAAIRKIRQRIIDLTDQQVLAIIQACHGLGFRSHTPNLSAFRPFFNYSVLRKS